MPKIEANGLNIYYEIHGNGEPVLLIRGLGGRGRSFTHQVAGLSPYFTVITFDNRGVGETDQPQAPYTIADMADDTAALLAALGIDSAYVFGISMGGMIAQELVLRHPKSVRRLALGCTHAGRGKSVAPASWVMEIMQGLGGKSPEQLKQIYARIVFSEKTMATNPALIDEIISHRAQNNQSEASYRLQLEAIYKHDTYDRLHQIQTPTLVLTGKEDLLVPPENSRLLADAIPGARLIEFDDAGHIFFAEKADEVNRALSEFFSS